MEEPDRVIVRDRRRLDPLSGELREPAAPAPAAGAAAGDDAAATPAGPPDDPIADPIATAGTAGTEPALDAVAELTADLQRLSAEYANYRRRVERDRVAVLELATARVLGELLPLLDDVDRARQHGDLTGGFKGVGEGLEVVTGKLGLERYGEVGEPFDPQVHEAVMQAEPDPGARVPVCAMVLQPGFRISGRVLRPARVAVAEPAAQAAAAGTLASAEVLEGSPVEPGLDTVEPALEPPAAEASTGTPEG